MAEKKKMSVAEILAAARKTDSKSGEQPAAEAPPVAPAPAAEPAPAEAVADSPPEAAEAAPKPAKPAAAKGARPSVAEMLAAARGEKSKPAGAAAPKKDAKPAGEAGPKAAPKPSEKPAKPAAKTAKAEVPSGPKPIRDTASILAAARAGAKAGPISKAEAAARPAPTKPAAAKTKPTKPAAPKAPVKPAAFAKPKPEKKATPDEGRRGFLGLLVGSFMGLGFTALSVTTGLWTLGTVRFMFPNVLTEPPSRFKVGPPANFPPGQVETKFVAQFGVWLVNGEYQGQPQIYALKTVCTHLGCTPNWLEGEQKFKCPCHGSGFYKDGINFEGPAPRPLERYAISLADDGQLQIDKSKTFQEEIGQWANPESFVTA